MFKIDVSEYMCVCECHTHSNSGEIAAKSIKKGLRAGG